ncbi:MAG: CDP-glycerol glycerophosphotransferase [Micromonosporaceae bacterium]|nr:CDP-glycerol glycerophosphotransferase [Micromonosporaceae bacterium]
MIARRLLGTALPTALATIALGVALLTQHRQLALLTAAAVLAVILWRSRSLATGPSLAVPRTVLAITVVSADATGASTLDWPRLLAGVALVGMLQLELPLFRAGRPLYRVAHLPAPSNRLGRLFHRRAASAGHTVLLAAVILFALASWPGWPLLVATAGAAAVTGGTVLAAVRLRLIARGRTLAGLRQQVSEYRPVFMVYFTAPPGSTYQLTMWLPHLEQLGERFVVVLREPNAFRAVAAATGAPVLYTPAMATFDASVVDSLKAVFYVNNGAKNTHCVRYGGLTHIFLNHGDSDKASSFNPVTAMYDRVFVAGQAGVDRYLHYGVDIPPHKFRIVGRPQVAAVRPPELPLEQVTEPVVLYAPTWTGHYADANYSSLPLAAAIVRALLDRGATVILRHHPYSLRNRADAARLAAAHRLLAADAVSTGRRHRWGRAATAELSLIDCFNASDALICDVSSVASDYLYSDKPFGIVDMAGQGDEFVETFPLARVGYVIDQRAANLTDVLDRLLKSDPHRPDRLLAKVHYLGDLPRDRYAEAFVAEARRHL